jgi:hypothetical protein
METILVSGEECEAPDAEALRVSKDLTEYDQRSGFVLRLETSTAASF